MTLLVSRHVLMAALLGAGLPVMAQPAPRPVAPVMGAATLERQEIRAQLTPRRFTTIAAEVGARVQRISVPEGGAFRTGQVLVSFDCAVPQAQLAKARAELEAVQATHASNTRLAELNAVGHLELEQSRTAVGKGQAEVNAMQAVLGKCAIAAPFGGRVAEQKAREQQYVQPGQPLLDIIDDSVLELEFLVPSRWLAWLRPGARFEVGMDETGRSYPARITRVAARIDPVSQSVKVGAAIDGRFPDLLSGMSGRVLLAPPN